METISGCENYHSGKETSISGVSKGVKNKHLQESSISGISKDLKIITDAHNCKHYTHALLEKWVKHNIKI